MRAWKWMQKALNPPSWIRKALNPPINADERRHALDMDGIRETEASKPIRVYLRLSADSKLFACITLLCCLWIASPAFGHGPDIARDVGFDQHPGAQLPMRLAFTDDTGRATTLAQALRAKPAVLVLGYLACKDLCPTTLAGVAQALDGTGLAAGRDYRALFVSIDPRETAADLGHEKAERIAAKERSAWTFLRGEKPSVEKLAHAVGFRYRYEPDRDAFAHAAGFAVLTPDGGISRYFMGVRYDPSQLASALREAGQGSVAPPASPLLLLCYHFDPTTGRYSLAILDILRAAIAALFVAGAAWAWLHRRRKRAREARR